MVLLALVAVGCATGRATPVAGPDPGRRTYSVTCTNEPAKCYEAAGRACGGAYDILKDSGGTTVAQSPIIGPDGQASGSIPVSRYDGQMLVACKK